MKRDNEQNRRINILIERYFDGVTTEAEERELRVYFSTTKQLPEELREMKVLFEGLDALAEEQLPQSQPVQITTPRSRRLWAICGVAAAAAVALGLFFGAELVRHPYCYIDGKAIYNKEVAMQTTVYLQGFAEFQDPAELVDELIKNN